MSKALSSNLGFVDLSDWNIDRTGQTDVSAQVQQWQDQALAAGLNASAPFGNFRLDNKVTFKVSTKGAGIGRGAHQAAPQIGVVPTHTMFFNGAINNNSWMIDVNTLNGNGEFAFLKGFRLHANGKNVSLLRILSVESDPIAYSLEKFLWEEIVAYGGWVNLEHFGYGGSMRRIYSRGARLSAMRAYLCNAMVVEGGWFGATDSSSWMFEVFGRQTTFETVAGIHFNQTVFQNDDGNDAGNGLRISENVQNIKIHAYFENIVGSGSVGAIALAVGCNKSSHPSPLIPTAIDEAGADAPTNEARYAVKGISIDGTMGTTGPNWDYTKLGPRYRFGNVIGIEWGESVALSATRIEYSKHALDINGHPINFNMSASNGAPGNYAKVTGGPYSAGATALTVDSTTWIVSGSKGYITLDNLGWGNSYLHPCTITVNSATSITISPGIPTGRTVSANNAVSTSRFEVAPPTLRVKDELNRIGRRQAINLMPPGNFIGSSTRSLRTMRAVFANSATGITFTSDPTITRDGKSSLKVTRQGAAYPGALVRRLWMYPYGSDAAVRAGVPIVVSGWIRLDNTAGYNSLDQSGSSTQDQPYIGICWKTPTGEQHSTTSFVMLNGQNATRYDEWVPFFMWFVIEDPTVTDVGLSILPSNGAYNATTDFSIWLSDLCLTVNPMSFADVRDGRYIHSEAAGRILNNGAFEVDVSSLPSVAEVYIAAGDKFNRAAGAGVAPVEWYCVGSGTADIGGGTSAKLISVGNETNDVTRQRTAVAIADNSTACLPAFKEAMSRITSRAGTVLVPEPPAKLTGTPLFRLDEGAFFTDSHGMKNGGPSGAAEAVYGGVLDLRYRIGLLEGPALLPPGFLVSGRGSSPRNTAEPVSSEIRALANMKRRIEATSITSSGTTCTVAAKNHDLQAGDLITISGATNGSFNRTDVAVATTPSADSFTYAGTGSFTGTATGPFKIVTSARPRVAQLVPAGNINAGVGSGDSCRIENANIHGNDIAKAIGVWSDSAQELSGLKHVSILACHTAVKIVASSTVTPANFVLNDLNVICSAAADNNGNGIDVFAAKWRLEKATVVMPVTSNTLCPSAYVVRGQDAELNGLHFENADYGATIGGPSTGVGGDNGSITANVSIRGLTGYNNAAKRGLISMARIAANTTAVANIELHKLSLNAFNKGPPRQNTTTYNPGDRVSIASDIVQLLCISGGTTGSTAPAGGPVGSYAVGDGNVLWQYIPVSAFVWDEVNDIIIPASTTDLFLKKYEFGGRVGVDAGNNQKRPVFTSYYDSVAPGGALISRDAGTTLNRKFDGARAQFAQVIQISDDPTNPANIDMLSDPLPGAVVILHFLIGNPTIRELTGANANNQIITGSGNITSTNGKYFRLSCASATSKWTCVELT